MYIDMSLIFVIIFAIIFLLIAFLYNQLSKAKDALEISHTKLKTIFDITMEAIVIYDENHNIKETNETTLRLFGYTKEELIGRNLLEFVAPEMRSKTVNILKHKKQDIYETRVIKKDGTIFPILVAGRYINIQGKNVRVSILMDLTALKQTQYKLEELNRSLENRVHEEANKNREKEKTYFEQSRLAQMGEMISMIAHQWRQPLGAIASTVTNIEAKMSLDKFDLQTESGANACKIFLDTKLQHINTYVQDLSKTIDDFRNFYNPNKEQNQLSILVPIEKALKIMQTSLINHNITLKKDFKSDKVLYLHDGEFMQVILNILKNAQDQLVEKEVKNPTIHIEVYEKKEAIMIKIQDNAGGIPKEHFENLFIPYFSTKGEKNGTGLGLYMSKVIIEEHHLGKISAQNKNNGAQFIIELKSDII